MAIQEELVRKFYDEEGDEGFHVTMGPKGDDRPEVWHHTLRGAAERGLSEEEAAKELVEYMGRAARLDQLHEQGLGARVLEFGSGRGGSAIYTVSKWDTIHVVGISNSAKLTENARRAADKLDVADRVDFHDVGNREYEKLNAWDDESFHAVMFYESVCHLPTAGKKAFVHAAHRVLKPGGFLVGIDWCSRNTMSLKEEKAIKRIIEPVNYGFQVIIDPMSVYVEAFTAAGFDVEAAEDMWEGELCTGSAPDPENDPQGWSKLPDRLANGKLALDRARKEGAFTICKFAARKPLLTTDR